MFAHRQLYVSMSKVSSFENLKIQICLTEKIRKATVQLHKEADSREKVLKLSITNEGRIRQQKEIE